MPAPKLTFQLIVEDLDTTEAFYAGVLGVPVQRAITVYGAPEHLKMESGQWELVFVEEAAAFRNHPLMEDHFSAMPKGVGMIMYFQVEEIEEIYAELLEEGLGMLYPLEVKPYGMKELWCFDPDGYLVVLEEPVRRVRPGSGA